MSTKRYALVNLASVILVLVVNGLSQSQRWNNTTIGEISNTYDNLFTPASYAFAIWGLIFLMLIAYALFQIRRAFFSAKTTDFIKQTGPWFVIANVCNAAWVIAFMYDYIGLSVLIMLGILISLLQIIRKTNMERWGAPVEIIAFVWWPICIYSGWIAVATIANFSAFFASIDLMGSESTQITWTIVMIIVAVGINLFMIAKRNMREFALVTVWALVAIFIRHHHLIDTISYTALVGAILLFIAVAIHGFKNRSTAPHIKLQQRLQQKK